MREHPSQSVMQPLTCTATPSNARCGKPMGFPREDRRAKRNERAPDLKHDGMGNMSDVRDRVRITPTRGGNRDGNVLEKLLETRCEGAQRGIVRRARERLRKKTNSSRAWSDARSRKRTGTEYSTRTPPLINSCTGALHRARSMREIRE